MNITEKKFLHYSIEQLQDILKSPNEYSDEAVQTAFIILSENHKYLSEIHLANIKHLFNTDKLKSQIKAPNTQPTIFQSVSMSHYCPSLKCYGIVVEKRGETTFP